MEDQELLIPPPAATEQITMAEVSLAFATIVATDGRLLRLDPLESGGLVLTMEQRKPVVLDRFQAGAFRAAVLAMGGEA